MIKGEIVGLRAVEKSDLLILRDWRNLEHFRKNFRGGFRELNMANQDDWFNRIYASPNDFMFVIERLDDKTPIGVCGLTYINWVIRSASFSFYIGDKEKFVDDEGYSLEAIKLLLDYGFDTLNMHKIVTELYEFDKKISLFTDKRVGFIKEGVLRDNCFVEGRYWNSYIYSLLKSEYENEKKFNPINIKNMKTLAIIPARGGSKRIPRKNIKQFLGQPIINYSIKTALASGCFDEVMVSTDDLEIAQIAKEAGAQVPFMRSAENSTDMTFTAPVLIEVINEYKKLGKEFDNICCIYPTAPFITAERLQLALRLLVESGAEGVIPVVRFSHMIQQALKIENNRVQMIQPENYNIRSQDLEPSYHDCGQFYFLKTASLLEQKILYPKFTRPIEIPPFEEQDINNEDDWQLAEFKYKFLHKQD